MTRFIPDKVVHFNDILQAIKGRPYMHDIIFIYAVVIIYFVVHVTKVYPATNIYS